MNQPEATTQLPDAPPAPPADGRPASAGRARLAQLAADVAPLAFAIPILLGIVTSVIRLLSVHHVELGWANTVDADGQALYLGDAIHQDPNDGFTGLLYTPLFPFILSVLYHVGYWTGWAVLLAELSALALLFFTAWLGHRPGRRWSWLGALGLGALSWWAVSALNLALVFEGRGDQLAWLFALTGLVAAASVGRGTGRRPLILGVALLTLGFWTKQNTIAADLAAVLWLGALALCGAIAWRRVALFTAALAAANVVVLALLNLLSDGWEWRLNFLLPNHQSQSKLITPWVREGLSHGALAYAFLIAMALVVLVRRPPALAVPTLARLRAAVRGWHGRATAATAAGPALAIFLVLGFAFGVYFRRKQGTLDNQFIGVVWAAGMLGAILWAVAGTSLRRGLVASGVVLAGLLVAATGVANDKLADHGVRVPLLHPAIEYGVVPPSLLELAKQGLVYDQLHSDVNVRSHKVIYPNFYNFVDLLAAGDQPGALVRAFEDRRFLYTQAMPEDAYSEAYSSSYGRWEENWLWKLNQVIAARYAPDPQVPGWFKRRSGPEQAVWQRTCFGPFKAAGTSWMIGKGGGLWCSPSPGQLDQRGTPSTGTEIRTEDPVNGIQGTLRVRTDTTHGVVLGGTGSGGLTELHLDRDRSRRYVLTLIAGGETLAQQPVRVGRDGVLAIAVRTGDPDIAVDAAGERATATLPLAKGVLHLTTDQSSGLHADLRALRVG